MGECWVDKASGYGDGRVRKDIEGAQLQGKEHQLGFRSTHRVEQLSLRSNVQGRGVQSLVPGRGTPNQD